MPRPPRLNSSADSACSSAAIGEKILYSSKPLNTHKADSLAGELPTRFTSFSGMGPSYASGQFPLLYTFLGF